MAYKTANIKLNLLLGSADSPEGPLILGPRERTILKLKGEAEELTGGLKDCTDSKK
jgi:hypothetical protein